ncbi:hypothetical protein C8R44DRAFT_747802 [Mycena epipterygia]|nr:hypothetical protein C8R44DRAFT_747802 [Mycena epipterygia]
MQCTFLIAFVVSCLTLSVSAAPISDSSLHITDRIPEIARAPEPELGCKIYSCICLPRSEQMVSVFLQLVLNVSTGASERRQMTFDSFYADIDWACIDELSALRVLVQFIPQIPHLYLRAEVTAAFKSERMTKHRFPKYLINVMKPLPTNAEHTMETRGMINRSFRAFEKWDSGRSKGAIEPEESRLISNIAQHETIIGSSCFELLANVRGRGCNRALQEANSQPTQSTRSLADSTEICSAFCFSESICAGDTAPADIKILLGTPWVDPAAASQTQHEDEAGREQDEEMEAEDVGKQKKKRHRSVHVEAADFTGDRVVADKALFLQDAGWWVFAAHAVTDDEIGRVSEIFKIWIFCFSGLSNRNYANYLLETYYTKLKPRSGRQTRSATRTQWPQSPSSYTKLHERSPLFTGYRAPSSANTHAYQSTHSSIGDFGTLSAITMATKFQSFDSLKYETETSTNS